MTIPQELVHKRCSAEVLVTSVTADNDGWIVSARLPGQHDFHSDAVGRQAGYHDPLLVLEAFRQGCIAASHLFYGVPLDFHYTLRYYQLSVLDLTALESDTTPAEFEFRVEILKEFKADTEGSVCGLTVAAMAKRNGVNAIAFSGSFGWVTDADWQRMRIGSSWETGPQPSRTESQNVGRSQPDHVVIGEPIQRHGDGSGCAPLLVDIRNPTFFDHPVDHLPGGLILESCRQLGLAILGRRASTTVGPVQMRCDFHSFAELNPTCSVALTRDGGPLAFRGVVQQSGQVRANVEVTFSGAEAPQ